MMPPSLYFVGSPSLLNLHPTQNLRITAPLPLSPLPGTPPLAAVLTTCTLPKGLSLSLSLSLNEISLHGRHDQVRTMDSQSPLCVSALRLFQGRSKTIVLYNIV
jgi:hypothetical protein